MSVRLTILGSILCLVAASAPADDVADRGKLSGKWQPNAGEKNDYGTWTLEGNSGSIRVTRESNGQKIAEYECNTVGRECTIKEAGHAAKVSIWYNGSKLVEMWTRGSEVVKRRFHVTGDGDMLELEVIPIEPGGPSEVIHMTRFRAETGHKPQ